MLKKLQLPEGIMLTPALKVLEEYLNSNSSLRPDASRPSGMNEVEGAQYTEAVKTYAKKLEEFNSLLQEELDAHQAHNSSTIMSLSTRNTELNEFRKDVEVVIEKELYRITKGMDHSNPLFPSWKDATRNRLWTIYGV